MRTTPSSIAALPSVTDLRATRAVDFLLVVAGAQAQHRDAVRNAAELIEDWSIVLDLADRHTVIPLLARSLRDNTSVPLPIRKELYRRHFGNSARNALQARELSALVAACQEAGVEVLAYKGLALATLAYGDPALRHPPGDIDLLFHSGDVSAAKSLLEARGYSLHEPENEQHHLDYRYHLHYQRMNPELHCEVHWRLTPVYWPFELDTERLWRDAPQVRIGDTTVRTFNAECTLLALCAHGAKEGWPKISQLVDLARLIDSHPDLDWDWVLAESRRMRRQRVLRLGLRLTSSFLKTKLPSSVEADLSRDASLAALETQIRAGFASERFVGTTFHRYALQVWHHQADQLRYLAYLGLLLPSKLQGLLQPSASDEEFVNLGPLPRSLYGLVRPFRVLWKYRDAQSILRTVKRNL